MLLSIMSLRMRSLPTFLRAASLRKTGISAGTAGDFRKFEPQDPQVESPATKSNARKTGISGLFAGFLGCLAERRNGWLVQQESNPQFQSGQVISIEDEGFEMTWPEVAHTRGNPERYRRPRYEGRGEKPVPDPIKSYLVRRAAFSSENPGKIAGV